jgi:enoyl-CoA hydratase
MKNLTINFGAVTTITITRPAALNALNQETLGELESAMQQVYTRDDIKGVIITGDGDKAFVAGADIRELASLSREKTKQLAEHGQGIFKMVENCPKPVIAAVNGFALGGGCELAMACHIRIASDNAKFGQPEVNLGTIPGYGGTQRLTQLVGRGKALELILTGDLISAQEAKAIGLVNHVTATKIELMELAQKIMAKILMKGPLAIAAAIKSVNEGFHFEEAGYASEVANFAELATTKDFTEGTNAFLEKRQPSFTGK